MAGDTLLYSSPAVTGGVRPFTFSINVSGVEFLKFERISSAEKEGKSADETAVAFVNAKLLR
jgi:hypothetical protein